MYLEFPNIPAFLGFGMCPSMVTLLEQFKKWEECPTIPDKKLRHKRLDPESESGKIRSVMPRKKASIQEIYDALVSSGEIGSLSRKAVAMRLHRMADQGFVHRWPGKTRGERSLWSPLGY